MISSETKAGHTHRPFRDRRSQCVQRPFPRSQQRSCWDFHGYDSERPAFLLRNRPPFEYKGTIDDVTIVDDYAHHPTEIKATLKAAKHYPHRKLWCVFQPHTYTRTKAFFQEFAEALSHADHVILADIYAARETDTLGVSSEALSDAIRSLGTDSHYFHPLQRSKHSQRNWNAGDLVLTMGAGDVVKIGEDLLK